jgi:hypothetical protein
MENQNTSIKEESMNNILPDNLNIEEDNETDIKSDMFQQSNLFIKQNNINEEKFPQKKHILDDEEEFKHLKEVVSAFFNYSVNIILIKG